ncbi:hypothetical protein P4597_18060 [Peribacillus simplex]|uniref:hypothetical protein n=1 Tax=Peribacillus simplex TaxID=1478 RepID=UPI002E1AD9B4|nr:hypothetical protein [Peribacillus simplex]
MIERFAKPTINDSHGHLVREIVDIYLFQDLLPLFKGTELVNSLGKTAGSGKVSLLSL